jgi:hypothetical protein
MNGESKMVKTIEVEELKAYEDRKAVAKERRAAAEKLKAATEDRMVTLEENLRAMENGQKHMFMDTRNMDEDQMAYVKFVVNKCCVRSNKQWQDPSECSWEG